MLLIKLLGLKHLAAVDLLVSICIDEFFDDHVASSDADHELAIHDLSEDLTGAEQVVAIPKTLDGHLTLHHVDVLGELLIDGVPLVGRVVAVSIGS